MRKIYLIRHGEPFQNPKHQCLGCHTDPDLTELGYEQARELAAAFDADTITALYSSFMRRSRETAEGLSAGRWEVRTLEGIHEMDAGDWEGLTFEMVKAGWPREFAEREKDLSTPPPNGESYDEAAERAFAAIQNALDETEGDIAIVAHAGIGRAIISRLLGITGSQIVHIKQPYTGVDVLQYDGAKLRPSAVGVSPIGAPDDQEIQWLYSRFAVPQEVIAHSNAVWEKAQAMAERTGSTLPLLKSACLLHDLCRTEENHPLRASDELKALGYLRLANIIAKHHDCPTDGGFNEAKLLFLADKLISGTEEVTLEQRFAESRAKCDTPEAQKKHAERYENALIIMRQYESEVQR